jgi:hypothetical protein
VDFFERTEVDEGGYEGGGCGGGEVLDDYFADLSG